MNVKEIEKYLVLLSDKLKAKGEVGELCIVGGAVMCLVFKARVSTNDIDGIFSPTRQIREAIREIAKENQLPENWLNDGVKGFIQEAPPREIIRDYSNLKVWAPTAEYMLAMKCVSARADTNDSADIVFLLKHLKIADKNTVYEIISKYYRENTVPAKTRFIVEEIVSSLNKKLSGNGGVKKNTAKEIFSC